MNNSVFGKTMENLRKRTHVELVHTERRLKRLVAKPNFHRFSIFNKDLTAVHLKNIQLNPNRPIYVGFSILDLSKTHMYTFHYDYIKQKYAEKAKLLFTDRAYTTKYGLMTFTWTGKRIVFYLISVITQSNTIFLVI